MLAQPSSPVAEALRHYSGLVAPPDGELERLLALRCTIEVVCRATVTNLVGVETIGSLTRGSALRGLDSLDVLVVAGPGTWASDPSEAIRSLAHQLGSALRVRSWPKRIGAFAEVNGADAGVVFIPAFPVVRAVGEAVLAIPGPFGGWIQSTPLAHAKFLAQAHQRAGRGLADVVRLLRTWSLLRDRAGALQPFPMELLVAASRACAPSALLPVCLSEAFVALQRAIDAGGTVRDPLGCVDRIELVDPVHRPEVEEEVCRARELAEEALVLEVRGHMAEAIRHWTRALGC